MLVDLLQEQWSDVLEVLAADVYHKIMHARRTKNDGPLWMAEANTLRDLVKEIKRQTGIDTLGENEDDND